MDSVRILVVLAAVLVLVLLYLGKRARANQGSFVDVESPLWAGATAKARASVPLLRELVAAKAGLAVVKYPLVNGKGETEHVWGELLELDETTFRATLETPLIGGGPAAGPAAGPQPLAALEDWQVVLPDGTIRGGYTTQAQIALARQAGHSVPRHIAELEGA
ncbi:MAG: hypothetical protein ACREOU_03780 [Candidatus Eiseniibacteriota bacterium]